MATSNTSSSAPESVSTTPTRGPGIDHLTVVPLNFDPDAPGKRRE